MKKSNFFILLLIVSITTIGQSPKTYKKTRYNVMFYNVENLFDTEDDPLTLDDEFLPKGDRFWNNKKFYNKLNRIFQVIIAAGGQNSPALIGVCEIENQKVLDLLLYKTPLGRMGYKIIHQESIDRRGIDVALLYRDDSFKPISYKAIRLKHPSKKDYRTRDILYSKGIIEKDTLHIFVNHWPSKYGGLVETKPLRAIAAKTLKAQTDSILHLNSKSKIIIMGDFNDSPFDESLNTHLGAKNEFEAVTLNQLYNLAYPLAKQGFGSNKYQGKWDLIDQFVVSGALLTSKTGLTTSMSDFQVIKKDFMLEKDKKYLGEKPFRTYLGFKYNNGFSDHLPIIIQLKN